MVTTMSKRLKRLQVFASSFAGDAVNVATIKANAGGLDVYFAPNFHPGQGNFAPLDGALNWMASVDTCAVLCSLTDLMHHL